MTGLRRLGLAFLLFVLIAALTVTGFDTSATADQISASVVPGASSLTTDAYSPFPVEVRVGDTVTWKNNDSTVHTVTSGTGPGDSNSGQEFDSSPNFDPLLVPGNSFSHTFDKEGTFPYYCGLHPTMVGEVEVIPSTTEPDTNTPTISVQTDKSSIVSSRDFITITGKVTGIVPETSVVVQLIRPDGNDFFLQPMPIEQIGGSLKVADGTYSLPPADFTDVGTWTVIASYDDASAQTTFMVMASTNNFAPASVAGSDQSVGGGKLVTLDGSGSFDGDLGTILTYEWTQTAGPAVTLSDPEAAKPTFTAPTAFGDTSLTFRLMVNDGQWDANDPDFVDIKVIGMSSAIQLELRNTPELGKPVQFGAFVPPDIRGTITNYAWDFGDGQTGSGGEVSHTYEQEGTYQVKLTVTDNTGASVEDDLSIVINPIFPIWLIIPVIAGIVVAVVIVILRRPSRVQGKVPRSYRTDTSGPDWPDSGSYQETTSPKSLHTSSETEAKIGKSDPAIVSTSAASQTHSGSPAILPTKVDTIPKEPAFDQKQDPGPLPPNPSASPVLVPKGKTDTNQSTLEAERGIAATDEALHNIAPAGYEITKLIGKGGFSSVYLAKKTDNNNMLALKIPKVDSYETLGRKFAEDFVREAKIWKSLVGYSIVQVNDFGKTPLPWIAIEYMEGGNLRDLLRKKGKIGINEAVELVLKVVDALIEAHAKGIVHLDIKPENILFTKQGQPKVADWGLARILFQVSTTTSAGFKGTLSYSAPEQFDSKKYGPTDMRTDIYQVAAVLYEMLTGNLPFKGDGLADTMMKILAEEPPPISKFRPELPEKLEPVILKAMAKRKQDRYEYAVDFKRELLKVMGKTADPPTSA